LRLHSDCKDYKNYDAKPGKDGEANQDDFSYRHPLKNHFLYGQKLFCLFFCHTHKRFYVNAIQSCQSFRLAGGVVSNLRGGKFKVPGQEHDHAKDDKEQQCAGQEGEGFHLEQHVNDAVS